MSQFLKSLLFTGTEWGDVKFAYFYSLGSFFFFIKAQLKIS